MNSEQICFGVCTAPTEQASVAPISNLIELLKPISKSLVIITGNASYDFFKGDTGVLSYDNGHPIEKSRAKRIFNYLHAQFRGALLILNMRNEVDVWFFFMGGEREFIQILTAKLLKKPTFLILTGSIVKSAQYSHDPFLIPIKMLNWISCNLVSGIIVYSTKVISDIGLERHNKKVFIAYEHYLNFKKFRVQTSYNERSPLIGYIGRLSEEKGVLNFIESLPMILDNQKDVKVIIGGDGPLKVEIEKYLEMRDFKDRVSLLGWISHEHLPEYMNALQLLIIPSYTEGGGPFIMLEAMASGTPVLATPVGIIPDVIKDGETGFIMENNTPNCIAKNIVRALNCPDIGGIADNGRKFVQNNYTFEKTQEKWKLLFQNIEFE